MSNIGWCQCLEESLSFFSCSFSSVWGVNIRKIFSVVFFISSHHNFKICLIYLKNNKSKGLFDCCIYMFLWVPRLTHPSNSTALTKQVMLQKEGKMFTFSSAHTVSYAPKDSAVYIHTGSHACTTTTFCSYTPLCQWHLTLFTVAKTERNSVAQSSTEI